LRATRALTKLPSGNGVCLPKSGKTALTGSELMTPVRAMNAQAGVLLCSITFG